MGFAKNNFGKLQVFLLVLLLSLMSVGVVSAQVCAAQPTSTSYWWRAEGSLFATVGRLTGDGALDGEPAYGVGKVGLAFDFSDDVPSWIHNFKSSNGPVAPSKMYKACSTEGFSVDLWVYPKGRSDSTMDSYANLFGQEPMSPNQSCISGGHDWSLELMTTPVGNDVLRFRTCVGYVVAPVSLALNQWHHVVASMDAVSGLELYVGGGGVASAPIQPLTCEPSTGINGFIGPRDSLNRPNVLLDEVTFYDLPLAPADVSNIFAADNLGKCIDCAGPIAGVQDWWPLDGATAGTTSNTAGGNDGGLFSTFSPPTFNAGVVNNSLWFDGSADYVDAGVSPILTEVTITGWVHPTEFVNAAYYKHLYGNIDVNGNGYKVELEMLSSPSIVFTVMNGGQTSRRFSLNRVNINEWNFFAATYSDSTDTLGVSVHGNPLSTLATAVSLAGLPSGEVNFGGLKGGPSGSWRYRGGIDEFQVFNRVLSDAEILELHNADGMGLCEVQPGVCGNDIIDGAEQCDGTNFDNQDCGFGGTLACFPVGDPNECTFDTSNCACPSI